ncbi:hypothetical protein [Streptomyces sp. NPDC001450]
MSVLIFVGSALLALMACVRADRVRAWRGALNSSTPDIPDSAFAVARVLLLGMAAAGVFVGFQTLAVADDAKWSSDELTSAVRGATDALDGGFTYGGPHEEDMPADFEGEYAMKIEDEITEHGGGDAPEFGVDAALSGSKSNEAYYLITADGADSAFCMQVERRRDKDSDREEPGIAGRTVTVPKFVFAVTSRAGEC